jgi:hypothetical protein
MVSSVALRVRVSSVALRIRVRVRVRVRLDPGKKCAPDLIGHGKINRMGNKFSNQREKIIRDYPLTQHNLNSTKCTSIFEALLLWPL